jgi:Delta3,5-Delta2,4-dienoyl-CoA isomerase
MEFQSEVLTIERDGHVATLWLDDADARNAMGEAFWRDLPVAMAALGDDTDVRAVVLAAKGPHFTAGIDVAMLASATGDNVAARTAFLALVKRLQASITSVAECAKPVIAAVHGACIGGGIDLITACDIRLCAPDARFSVRETRLAMVADVGTLQRLPRIVGPGHANELIYTGKDIDAARAREIGLVNDVADDVVAAAQELARAIAANSPLAVQGSKAILRRGESLTVEQGLDLVAIWNAAFIHSEDLKEAVTAFFEKRPPTFRGR